MVVGSNPTRPTIFTHTMKNNKPKSGYYIEKTDGFIYLYLAETKQWIYLRSNSKDNVEISVSEYESNHLFKRCKYVGNTVSDLVKRVVTLKINSSLQ